MRKNKLPQQTERSKKKEKVRIHDLTTASKALTAVFELAVHFLAVDFTSNVNVAQFDS